MESQSSIKEKLFATALMLLAILGLYHAASSLIGYSLLPCKEVALVREYQEEIIVLEKRKSRLSSQLQDLYTDSVLLESFTVNRMSGVKTEFKTIYLQALLEHTIPSSDDVKDAKDYIMQRINEVEGELTGVNKTINLLDKRVHALDDV